LGKLKDLGLTAYAGATFLRLYLLPTHRNELPATVRLQPTW
jgi:magnesium-protoporphyrin IX monomethyl ester (oxidative) cyclase